MNSINELYSLLKINQATGKREDNTFIIDSSEYVPLPPDPEPVEGFSITLYKNISENSRVDKTNYLTEVGGLDGALRRGTNVINPSILIYYNKLPDFNYVYITPFNRYYYVTTVDAVRTNLYEITLSIDVLMTYKDGIKGLSAFITRNEHTYNDFLIDDKRVIESGYTIDTITVENETFIVDDESSDLKGDFVVSGFALNAKEGEQS